MRRFEEIGVHIMNRSPGGMEHSPIGSVVGDRDKRRMVAQIIGQAYMKAHHLMLHNKDSVEQIAEVVIQKKEIYGDELIALLNGANLQIPEVDLTDERVMARSLSVSRRFSLAYVALAALLGVAVGHVRPADRASDAETASAVVGVGADEDGPHRTPDADRRARRRRSIASATARSSSTSSSAIR